MKKVYFVHRDKNAIERQSDGVEFGDAANLLI